MTESCIATCSRLPLPVRIRSNSALTMLNAISMPVPVSPIVGPGLTGLAGDAHRAAGGLGDRVEGQALLIGAARAEALDLGIDDARIDRTDDVITEPQPLDCAGREILGEDIGLFHHFLDQIEAALVLQIDCD